MRAIHATGSAPSGACARAGLAGLAIWWQDHPDVPRERIVETAVNAVWIGLERAGAGETWSGGPLED